MEPKAHRPSVSGPALLRAAACLLLAGGLAACGYQSESERAYFSVRESERQRLREQRDVIVAAVPDKEVLDLVMEQPAPDEVGKTSDWVAREANAHDGQLFFPRWQVNRRGANRYEVRFTYTVINQTNHLLRRGYSWNVDSALKLVGAPVALVLNEAPRPGRTFTQQRAQRIAEEEAALE